MLLARAEVRDVGVGAGPGVVGQIPAWMIWIFVDHDGVAVPVPVVDVVIVVGRDAKVKIVEPEAVAIAASKAVFMTAPKTAGETTVFPGTIDVIVLVAAAGIVTDPMVVVVDVRGLRMIGMIAEGTMILLRTTLLGAAFGWFARSSS